MLRGRSIAIVTTAVALLGAGACPPAAPGASSAAGAARSASHDAASTHALLVAGDALARAGAAKIPAAEANARKAIARFARQCPGAGDGAPQDENAQRMGLEVAGALWSAAYGTAAREIQTFVRAVRPLRWSDPRLTRRVQGYATGLGVLGSLPAPDLCGDVAKWRATGFTRLPASTETYDRLVERTEIHAIPERVLRRYEHGADHQLAVRIKRLEGRIERAEVSLGFEYWNTLLEKLGLPQ
jgi:hypothetical protein